MTQSCDDDAAEAAVSTIATAAAAAVRTAQEEGAPAGDAAAQSPPRIPLAPIKLLQAKFNPLADAMLYLVVFAGGCVGTGLRYGLALLIAQPIAPAGLLHEFHTATFIANMVSTFVLATLAAYLSQAVWLRKRMRELTSHGIGMGLCGGLSTLSTLAIEDLVAVRAAAMGGFLLYLAITFVCGFILAWFGARLGLLIAGRRGGGSVFAAAVPPAAHTADMQTKSPQGQTAASSHPAQFEPSPITDEIRLVPDPVTGEVR